MGRDGVATLPLYRGRGGPCTWVACFHRSGRGGGWDVKKHYLFWWWWWWWRRRRGRIADAMLHQYQWPSAWRGASPACEWQQQWEPHSLHLPSCVTVWCAHACEGLMVECGVTVIGFEVPHNWRIYILFNIQIIITQWTRMDVIGNMGNARSFYRECMFFLNFKLFSFYLGGSMA